MDQERSLQNKFIESLDKYYNQNPKTTEINHKININEFIKTYNSLNALRYLCCLEEINYQISENILPKETTSYNAVRCILERKLSKENRVKILRVGDLFESIEISCINPNDITSVILYVEVAIKKNTNLQEL